MKRHIPLLGLLTLVACMSGMAFLAFGQTLPSWTPTRIELMYTLEDSDGTIPGMGMSAHIAFYSDTDRLGQVPIHDVSPYLTTTEKQQIAAMMTRMRGVAEAFYGVGE